MKRGRAKRALCMELSFHLLMGTCLGLFCAILLLTTGLGHLREFFGNLPNPSEAEMSFVLGMSLMFAVGATITGYLFIAMDG